jgi:hypothetical protein
MICPECQTTALRRQAKQQVIEQEMNSTNEGFFNVPTQPARGNLLQDMR